MIRERGCSLRGRKQTLTEDKPVDTLRAWRRREGALVVDVRVCAILFPPPEKERKAQGEQSDTSAAWSLLPSSPPAPRPPYGPVILSPFHPCHLCIPATFTSLSPLHPCHLYIPVTHPLYHPVVVPCQPATLAPSCPVTSHYNTHAALSPCHAATVPPLGLVHTATLWLEYRRINLCLGGRGLG